MSGLLALACGLFAMLGVRELWAERGEDARDGAVRLLRGIERREGDGADGARAERLLRQIRLAGLEDRVRPAWIRLARAAMAPLAFPLALAIASMGPPRLLPLLLLGIPGFATLVPDLVLRRIAATRARELERALPPALDLMAVGAAAGRGVDRLLRDAERASPGALGDELGRSVAALDCGDPVSSVLGRLRSLGGATARMAVQLERSRRFGTPLAEALSAQAEELRRDQARELRESGARAAPKIQLVVALLLVPSSLLILAAAVLANADAIFSGL